MDRDDAILKKPLRLQYVYLVVAASTAGGCSVRRCHLTAVLILCGFLQ
jgi:hypothetical protein